MQVPKQDEASPYLTGAVTCAVLGTIAYRRPKALAIFAGMVALATAPYLGFMVITVNRFGRVRMRALRWLSSRRSGDGVLWLQQSGCRCRLLRSRSSSSMVTHLCRTCRRCSLQPSW